MADYYTFLKICFSRHIPDGTEYTGIIFAASGKPDIYLLTFFEDYDMIKS